MFTSAGAGENHVLLAQEVTGHGNAVTHGNLVGGTADTGDVDALGTDALCQSNHLGVVCVVNNHFGQAGIMAMNNDVDHVLLHHADVGGGVNGLGRAEQHIGQLGAHHRAAPAIGQAAAQRLAHQCFGQAGVAHMGHVQGGGNLAVDGAGLNSGVVPQLLGVLGCTLQEALGAKRLAVFHQAELGDLMSQVVDVLALGLNAPFLGDANELLGVLDLIIAALFCLIQGVADFTAMVRVGCGATGGEAQEVTANNAVDITAADTAGALAGNAAGAHGADTAAGARLAKSAVGSLVLDTLLPGVSADLLAVFQQRIGGSLHLINSGQICPILQSDFLLKKIFIETNDTA